MRRQSYQSSAFLFWARPRGERQDLRWSIDPPEPRHIMQFSAAAGTEAKDPCGERLRRGMRVSPTAANG
jgi:hypothetical protein